MKSPKFKKKHYVNMFKTRSNYILPYQIYIIIYNIIVKSNNESTKKINHKELSSSSQSFLLSSEKLNNTAIFARNEILTYQINSKKKSLFDNSTKLIQNKLNDSNVINNNQNNTSLNISNNNNNIKIPNFKKITKIDNKKEIITINRPMTYRENNSCYRNEISYNSIINDSDLSLMNQIMKNSPRKINHDLLKKRIKSLKKDFPFKHLNSFTEKKFYAYNLIYGCNSNNIIKTYTPKLSQRNFNVKNISLNSKINENDQVFTEKQIIKIFTEKCKDLNMPIKEDLRDRFTNFIKPKCNNRIINFSGCNLGKNTIECLGDILSKNDICSRLILDKNNLGDANISVLLNILKDNNNLIEISLESNSLTPKGGEKIFEYLINQKSIISINLSSNEGIYRNRICSEGVKLLENVLQKNLILEKLDLSSNSLRNDGFKYIINGLNNNFSLHYLNVSNNEITEKGIVYLHEKLETCKLNELNLSSNNISNKGCVLLGECLSSPKLNEIIILNLSDCHINFQAIKEFFLLISNNHHIKNLNFNKNNLNNDKWDTVDCITQITLKSLSFSDCELSSSVKNLAVLFKRHPSIKYLNLSRNSINDEYFKSFVDYPNCNLCLEEIDFSENYITDKSAIYFCENLRYNNSLKKINFYDNDLESKSANAIIESLKFNRNLIKINLKCNRIPLKLLLEIKKQIQNNKTSQKQKLLPTIKNELQNLKFNPNEIGKLQENIIKSWNEKIFFAEKFKESKKKFDKKEREDQKELNKVLKELELIKKNISNICENISEINNNLVTEEELSEIEKQKMEKKIRKLQQEINSLKNDYKLLMKDQEVDLYEIRKEYNKLFEEHTKCQNNLNYVKNVLSRKNDEYHLNTYQLDRLEHPEKYKLNITKCRRISKFRVKPVLKRRMTFSCSQEEITCNLKMSDSFKNLDNCRNSVIKEKVKNPLRKSIKIIGIKQ